MRIPSRVPVRTGAAVLCLVLLLPPALFASLWWSALVMQYACHRVTDCYERLVSAYFLPPILVVTLVAFTVGAHRRRRFLVAGSVLALVSWTVVLGPPWDALFRMVR